MKKIIFIDLDGTLKNNNEQISIANRSALIKAKNAGYEIVFATGRSFKYIEAINKELDNVCRYAISSTGGIIYDFAKNLPLEITEISNIAAALLCNKFLDPHIIWLAHCTDGLFSNVADAGQQNTNEFYTRSLKELLESRTVCAFVIINSDFDQIKRLEHVITQIPGVYISKRHKALTDPSVPHTGLASIDIIATGVSKGSGVRTLCAHLGIPHEDRIAIGDDMNDLSMFSECGFKVAMGNSLPEIKEIADHITFDNNNDGVAKFLLALIESGDI